MWLKKWKHNNKRNQHLAKLKPNDNIIINCPEGFHIIINEDLKYADYPVEVEVVSNDNIVQKLWIRFLYKKDKVLIILDYSSKELRNYLLFNIYSSDFKNEKPKKELSKEELEEQLKKAIDTGNFESAALINENLKNKK